MKALVVFAVSIAFAFPVNAQDFIPQTYAEEEFVPTLPEEARKRVPSTSCLQDHYKPSWGIVQVSAKKANEIELSTGCAVGEHCDGRRLFLTTNHGIRNASLVGVHAQGLNSQAEILASDANHDIALLAASVPANHPMRNWKIAQVESYEEEPSPFGGYSPETDQYRQVEPTISNLDDSRFWTSAHLKKGMSGGPVYDRETKSLKGIIVAVGRKKPWALAVNSRWLEGFMANNLDSRSLASVRSDRPFRIPSNWDKMNRTRIAPSEWVPVSYKVRGRVRLINWTR